MNGKVKACPECNEQISVYAKKCDCGWRSFSAGRDNGQDDSRFVLDAWGANYSMCSETDNGKRCSKAGTMCESPYGNNWVCSEHYRNSRG